jgi:hypothetical protein
VTEDYRKHVLEAAYARLRERLSAKEVTADHLKNAAMEALDKAKVQIELDPQWVDQELTRMREGGPTATPDPPIED